MAYTSYSTTANGKTVYYGGSLGEFDQEQVLTTTTQTTKAKSKSWLWLGAILAAVLLLK